MGIPVSQRPGRAVEPELDSEDQSKEARVEERREGTRKTLIGGRLVTVRLGSDGSGLALDLSESGIGLRAFPDLAVGSTTTLLFEVPGINSRIEAAARVEWVERNESLWSKGSGGRAGLRFVNLDDATRSLLKQWIAEELPRLQALKKAVQSTGMPSESPAGVTSHCAELRDELHRNQLTELPALQWIVERILQHTPADGAAIALDDGQGMVCRATFGNAPDLGVRINSNSGLSGECVRSGQIVHCEDTDNDPRVDAALCRELNLRCVLIFPLYRSRQLCGVLEAFCAKPFSFTSTTVSFLQQVADLAVEAAADMLPDLGSKADNARRAAEAIHRGVINGSLATFSNEASQQLVGPKSPENAKATDSRKVVRTAALSDTIPCDVCGYLNPRGQRICSKCDVPLSVVENFLSAPTDEQEREAQAAVLLARSRYGVGEPLPATPVQQTPNKAQTNPKLKPAIAAGVLLLMAALAIGIWKGAEPEESSSVAEAPVTAQSEPAAPEVVPASTPAGSSITQAQPEPKSAEPAPKPPETSRSTARSAAPVASKTVPAAPGRSLEDATSVRWILNRDATKGGTAPVEPASLPVASGQLPSLPYIVVVPQPPSVARQRERISEGVTGGELIRRVNPAYPTAAKSAGKKGSVVLAGTVDREGILQNLRALEGDPVLVGAALAAARNWRYAPYKLNGNPIEIETKIVFHFR